MQLILSDENFEYYRTIHFESFDLKTSLLGIKNIKTNLNATLSTFDKNISCSELQNIRTALDEYEIKLVSIVTSSRETNVSAKHLKINTDFNSKDHNYRNKHLFETTSNDITHKGIIRSGEKISSNGNLIIIGDVNPGAQISAKLNIYVWGKLCGIAFAGLEGEEDSFITSLYLNPLQLRINKTVATGPKEKPNTNYPEIATLEEGKIVIKPLLINK